MRIWINGKELNWNGEGGKADRDGGKRLEKESTGKEKIGVRKEGKEGKEQGESDRGKGNGKGGVLEWGGTKELKMRTSGKG